MTVDPVYRGCGGVQGDISWYPKRLNDSFIAMYRDMIRNCGIVHPLYVNKIIYDSWVKSLKVTK